MALPVLSNDKPMYEVVVPSTQEMFKFRPFLVKEQKSMLVAFESKDNKQILNTMLNCVESCVPGLNVKELATFDMDYIFTQIRAKSVGETSTIRTACVKCNEENEVVINLEKIKMEKTEIKSQIVPITDTIKVEMKYPTYDDVLRNPNYMNEDANPVEAIFDSIATCLYAVQSGDENILVSQEPKEEIEKFVNSLNTKQLEKISEFVEKIPMLTYEEKFKCKKCNHENTLRLRGIQDFF
tara:strand:+ start:7 stop:723 length:717 start_codon:yes stop_codon:yes gene_type:complete